MSNLPDFRMVVGTLRASRSLRGFVKARGSTDAAKQGLRYENRVAKQLERHVELGHFLRCEHNPWFTFNDTFGSNNCSPDFLLHTPTAIIIVEVKLTYVEVAIHKLNDLYSPVVSKALGVTTWPLIIVRNVTPLAPLAALTLRDALASPHALLHWPDNGRIIW